MTQQHSGPSSSPPGPSSLPSSSLITAMPITLNNIHRPHHHPLKNHHSHASLSPPTSPPSGGAETAARTLPNGPHSSSSLHKSRQHRIRGERGGASTHEESSSDNELTVQHRILRRRELRGNSKLGQNVHTADPPSGEDTVPRLKRLNSLKVVDVGQGGSPTHSGLRAVAAVNGSPRRTGFDSHLACVNYRGGGDDSESIGNVEQAVRSTLVHLKEDSHALRSRTAAAAASLRARPYTINHKTSNKS